MKKVGLFFGSFNPIHVGHLIIANHLVEHTELDEVWFVVSPQNPDKQKASMLEDDHRMALVRLAIEDNPKFKASNVEFDLPKPSYTIRTLVELSEQHPSFEFALIMGEDNLRSLHKWKSHQEIVQNHHVYVYPRINQEKKPEGIYANHPSITYVDAPVMKISASHIRKCIKDSKSVEYMLTEPVYQYVEEMHFYK